MLAHDRRPIPENHDQMFSQKKSHDHHFPMLRTTLLFKPNFYAHTQAG
jgi:hypothetical protein